MPSSYPVDCQSIHQAGIHQQRTEVGIGSHLDLHLPRRRLQFGDRCCTTYNGEGRQTSFAEQDPENTPTSRGQVCVIGVGLYERHHRHHIVGIITHETTASVSDKPVVHVHTTSFSSNLLEHSIPESSVVVDRCLQSQSGQTETLCTDSSFKGWGASLNASHLETS